jgi:hypothetical protein
MLAPVTEQDALRAAAADPPQPVDWYAEAGTLARNYADRADEPRTFSQPRTAVSEPCRRRTQFDKETTARMDELLPPPRDPIPPGGHAPASSSVRMGSARVGIIRFGGGKREEAQDGGERRSSFKWAWESTSDANGGFEELLTEGFAEPRPYAGMFDDMEAGRTPDSSVPDPNLCD